MSLSDELLSEVEKWKKRLDEKLASAAATDETGGKMLSNVKAYRRDCEHFLARGELLRSFECLIWAWAYLEIGLELGYLIEK